MTEENRFQRFGSEAKNIDKILRDLQALDKEVQDLKKRIAVLESKP